MSTIYIGKREYKYGRMIMSHMVSRDLDALHQLADYLGISRRHFQDKPGKPHYDICKQNKLRAIEAGAEEVDDRFIVKLLSECYR